MTLPALADPGLDVLLIRTSNGTSLDITAKTGEWTGMSLGDGYDFGDGESLTSKTDGTLLDGAPVYGERTGNRQHTLPIHLKATSRAGLRDLTELLVMAVQQPAWQLRWTPPGLGQLVWDCYRASCEVGWSQLEESFYTRTVTVTCDAQPFGSSPDLIAVVPNGDADTSWRRVVFNSILGSAPSPLEQLVVRPQDDTKVFKAVLLHLTDMDSPQVAQQVAGFTAPTSDSFVTFQRAIFTATAAHRGPYSLLLTTTSLGTQPTTATVEVWQEDTGTFVIARQTFTVLIDPTNQTDTPLQCGIVRVGNVNLPLGGLPPDSTGTRYEVRVSQDKPSGATTLLDAVLLDANGSTLLACQPPTVSGQFVNGTRRVFVDPAGPLTPINGLWVAGSSSRADSRSPAYASIAGAPLTAQNGTSLLAYSPGVLPTVTAQYRPRWLTEPPAA